jgi:uncharacterized membrane protein YidH (DUF202 family)
MKNLKKLFFVALAFIVPAMASAQYYVSGGTDLDAQLANVKRWIGTITPILVALAILMTIYNAFKLITAKDDAGRKEARSAVTWSVVAIAVIVGFWAIALALLKTAGLGAGSGDIINYVPSVSL